VDLLEKADLLKAPTLEGINEWYCISYSEHLFQTPSLWKPAAEYLLLCPRFGKSMLEEVLPLVELDSPSKSDQVLSFCKTHDLKVARLTILRILGCSHLKKKLYNQAISYYMDANDLHHVVYIVDELLDIYVKNGDNVYESVVKNIAPALLFKSPRLAFLARYCEFQSLYRNKEFKKAADLVVLLLSSGSAPRKFWRTILLDTLPLLEGQLQVFSVEQVMELMRCAEICSLHEESKTYKPRQNCILKKGEEYDDEFDVIRLATSRALAAAIIENQ
jgi:nuclear pore complex protein Nup85